MEVLGVVKDGCVVLPTAIHLQDGTPVRIIVDDSETTRVEPYERESLSEASVLADIAWATGKKPTS